MTNIETLNAIMLNLSDSIDPFTKEEILNYCEKNIASLEKQKARRATRQAVASADHTAMALSLLDLLQTAELVDACSAHDLMMIEGVPALVGSQNRLVSCLGKLDQMGKVEVTHPKQSGPYFYKVIVVTE